MPLLMAPCRSPGAASLQHATAGLLPPGVHRVVGDPYGPAQSGRNSGGSGGSARGPAGRRLLHFDLRPHPAAVLDLRAELEAAGHTVSRRSV